MSPQSDETVEATLARVRGMSHGFWQSAILLAGVETGLFAALAEAPRTPQEAAAAMGCDPRGVTILCRALAAFGLLRVDGGRFAATPDARAILVPGGERDQTSMLKHLALMWENWGQLAEVVRTGKIPRRADAPADAGEEGFRAFIEAMHQAARPSAAAFAALDDFACARKMLDVGGGPGTYVIAMAERRPELQATILDRAGALAIARAHAQAAGVADRIELREGDAVTDPYGEGYDIALLSQLLHAFGPDDCRTIVRKAAAALAPSGILVINEFALDATGAAPLDAAVFGVNMLVNTDEGWSYKADELEAWQREAGLEPFARREIAARSTLFLARKPVRSGNAEAPRGVACRAGLRPDDM